MNPRDAPRLADTAILCRFPGAPALAYVAFKVDDKLSLTSAELRETRAAVFCLPLRGFDTIGTHCYSRLTETRWICAYVIQLNGPAISNFSIQHDVVGFRVRLDNGLRITANWRAFPTISRAVAAIGKHVEERQEALNLKGHDSWPFDVP